MRRLVFLALIAAPVSAETIVVRTGEHADFSRVVLSPSVPTKWSLVQSEKGYRLTFARDAIKFDSSNAFNLIPRDRILKITPGDEAASLDFILKAGVIAKGFETPNGAVVVDFAAGTVDDIAATAGQTRTPLTTIASLDPITTQFYWRGIMPSESMPPPQDQENTNSIAATFDVPKDDTRIIAAEQQLLTQLSRAAAQGLVKVDPIRPKPVHKTETVPAVAPTPELETLEQSDPLAYQMKTAIDRELTQGSDDIEYTGSGAECLPDSDLDFANWVNDESPAIQIADARRDLVGEFDKAKDNDVIRLAKLYLGLSFGAEATAVLTAFDPQSSETDTLLFLAHVLDKLPVDQSSPILGMVECETAASMWALLGAEQPQSNHQINFVAVQRAYSALPPALRLAITDQLIEKLIVNKAPDIARLIRKIAARIEPEGDALRMSDARLNLAQGETAKAEQGLEGVVAENGADAVEALLMLVETQFVNGDLTDTKTVENVAALAFEHRFSDDGAKLARALVLAATAARQYDRATHELLNWPVDKNGTKVEVATKVYAHIVRDATDVDFLSASMEHSALWNAQSADLDVRIRAGERYLELGFPDQVIDLLSRDQKTDGKIAKLVARAHLLRADGAKALDAVQTFSDSESDTIRAEAFAIRQQSEAAANAFIASGDTLNASREAWKAGEWDIISRVGSPEEQEVLRSLSLTADSVPEVPVTENEPGPIAQSQELIDESARIRAALDALLTSQR